MKRLWRSLLKRTLILRGKNRSLKLKNSRSKWSLKSLLTKLKMKIQSRFTPWTHYLTTSRRKSKSFNPRTRILKKSWRMPTRNVTNSSLNLLKVSKINSRNTKSSSTRISLNSWRTKWSHTRMLLRVRRKLLKMSKKSWKLSLKSLMT